MFFESSFVRAANVAGIANLGTDGTPPTTPLGSAASNIPAGGYAGGGFRCVNGMGVPPKVLWIGFSSTGGSNVSANLFIFDTTTKVWLLLGSTLTLVSNTLTSVTIPAVTTQRGVAGAVEWFLSCSNASAANGTYTFDVTPGM